jgi:ABC-type nitrate/sulfonate/bicarbonate transport system substrate-binding protein
VRSKIARLLAGTPALLLLLAAPVEAQTPRERETVQVGLIDRTFFPQPVMVAIQNGYFADEGLNANIRFIRSGEGQAEGLTKGDLQFALSSVEGIMQNVERGGPLRLLAANSGRLSHFIITQKKFARVEDLKGATVGILTLTEGSFFNWQDIALKHGLKYPDDYKVMQTAGAGARHHLLLEGKIDVGLQSIPWAYVAEDAGFNNLGAASDYVPDWQFTTYNARPRLERARPAPGVRDAGQSRPAAGLAHLRHDEICGGRVSRTSSGDGAEGLARGSRCTVPSHRSALYFAVSSLSRLLPKVRHWAAMSFSMMSIMMLWPPVVRPNL